VSKDNPLEELAGLQRVADLSDDDKIREIRRLESRLAKANIARKNAVAKHKQAEADLQLSADREELLLATQDPVEIAKFERSRMRKGRGKASAIICVNDWHIEETVEASVVDNCKFNLRIAEKRINNTWDKAEWLLDMLRSMASIKEVILWAGGDMISGYIHPELQENNSLGPAEAIQLVQEHLVHGLNRFMKDPKTDSVVFVTSFGNHGRTTRKRRISTGYKSHWEWAAYHNVAKRCQDNSKFRAKIADGYFNKLPVQGHQVRFHHGDDIRYKNGVGGVHVPLRRAIGNWNLNEGLAAFDVLGHFHQYGDDPNYVLCGSLMGYNAYAQSIAAPMQSPSQTIIGVDYEHGKWITMPVFCGESHTI